MAGAVKVQPRSGHSAIVEMRVEADGVSYKLCEVGSNFIVIDEDVRLGPVNGEIVVTVDGREHRQKVFFKNGLRRGENLIEAGCMENP